MQMETTEDIYPDLTRIFQVGTFVNINGIRFKISYIKKDRLSLEALPIRDEKNKSA